MTERGHPNPSLPAWVFTVSLIVLALVAAIHGEWAVALVVGGPILLLVVVFAVWPDGK